MFWHQSAARNKIKLCNAASERPVTLPARCVREASKRLELRVRCGGCTLRLVTSRDCTGSSTPPSPRPPPYTRRMRSTYVCTNIPLGRARSACCVANGELCLRLCPYRIHICICTNACAETAEYVYKSVCESVRAMRVHLCKHTRLLREREAKSNGDAQEPWAIKIRIQHIGQRPSAGARANRRRKMHFNIHTLKRLCCRIHKTVCNKCTVAASAITQKIARI